MQDDTTRREYLRYYAMTGSAALAASLAGCSGGGGGDTGGGGGNSGGGGSGGKETGGGGSTSSKMDQWREKAKDEGPLTVATTIDPSTVNSFGKAVNEKFPFIKLRPLDLPPEELESRFISEYQSGNPSIDLVMSRAWTFINQGMGLDLTQLPNYADLPEEAKGGDTWASYKFLVISGFYNTDMMSKSEAPSEWGDIMKSKYKDKMIASTSARPIWVRWMEKNVDKDFVSKFAPLPAEITNSSGTAMKKVAAGVYPVDPYGFTKYLFIDNRAGSAPVDNLFPTLLGPATIMGNKKAPNMNTLKFFLNWYFTEEAAKIQAQQMPNECMGTADNLICNPSDLTTEVKEHGVEVISNSVDVVNLDREAVAKRWSDALLQG